MVNQLTLRSGASCLAFDPSTGAIVGLMHNQAELLLQAAELFTMQVLDLAGNPISVKSSEFKSINLDPQQFHYAGHPLFPTLEVDLAWRSTDGTFFVRPSVHHLPKDYIMEWIDAPQVVVSSKGNLFSPFSEGVIITDPEKREASQYGRYRPLEFAKRGYGYGGLYPGVCQMQFLAFYNPEWMTFAACFGCLLAAWIGGLLGRLSFYIKVKKVKCVIE